jgi:ubiquitin C-terminal hydrolase
VPQNIKNAFVPINTEKIQAGYGVVGIQNEKNNCFINSVLQCLFQVPPLFIYFLMKYDEEELKKPKESLLWEFGALILLTEDLTTTNIIKPKRFLTGLELYLPFVIFYWIGEEIWS